MTDTTVYLVDDHELFLSGVRTELARNFTIWGWIERPSKKTVEEFLSELRLLTHGEMRELFPDCTIFKEKWMGMTKSYVAYRA